MPSKTSKNLIPKTNFSPKQLAILQPFFDLETWEERYEYLMDLGEKLPQMPESFKIPARRVLGCQSRVWLEINFVNNKAKINLESDALIVRGFLLIIKTLFEEKTPEEIINFNPNIPQLIGLEKKISITRLTGIDSVIQVIQKSAKNFQK